MPRATGIGAATSIPGFMTAVGEIDLHKIREYVSARVPVQHQDTIRMEVDVRCKPVTFLECRQPWHEKSGTEWTRQGVARKKHDSNLNQRTLFLVVQSDRWHVFDLIVNAR
jgi:hypothetical protein